MKTAQEIYNVAIENYATATRLIQEMGKKLQNINESYSIDIALGEFDLLLQGILLHVAISDNRLDQIEIEAIDKITDHRDLLSWINVNYNTTLTWAQLYSIPESKIAEILSILEKDFLKQATDLYDCLALVDICTDFDYYEALKKCMLNISLAIMHIDGDLQEDIEYTAGANALNLFYYNPYQNALQKTAALQAKLEANANSLEANFDKIQKKN